MMIARQAFIQQQDIAFALPAGSEHSPLLIPIKMLLGSMLEEMVEEPLVEENCEVSILPTDTSVFLMSPSVYLRTKYLETSIGEDHRTLLERFPAFRCKRDGTTVPLVRIDDQHVVDEINPLCFFLGRQKVFP